MPANHVLVTGAAGFIGSRLIPSIRKLGVEATAATFDVLDADTVRAELERVRPTTVIHLAAISHVPTCQQKPEEARRVNIEGTQKLLEGLAKYSPRAHLIFASTAQVYAAPSGNEISSGVEFAENRRIAPQNVYATTKWQAEEKIRAAAVEHGLGFTILRLFNHTHRSQSPDFFLPHLYRSLQEAVSLSSGSGPGAPAPVKIPVGNLDLWRDIGTIQDLLAAFGAILQRPDAATGEVFNVCSGTAKHLRTLAEELACRMGAYAEFAPDSTRMRPGEPLRILGNCDKLMQATGWKPNCLDEKALIEGFLAP